MKCIQKNKMSLFITGWIIVMAAMLPYLILGENIVVFYHDQLDGEVLGYILHAKYLFTGIDTYPLLFTVDFDNQAMFCTN